MFSSGTTEDVSTSKSISKDRDFPDDQRGLENQDDNFLTPELKELLKKLNPRRKRRYNEIKSTEAKIAYLEGIKSERELGMKVLLKFLSLPCIALYLKPKILFYLLREAFFRLSLFPTFIGIILGIFVISSALAKSWIRIEKKYINDQLNASTRYHFSNYTFTAYCLHLDITTVKICTISFLQGDTPMLHQMLCH
ncbi:937_t:CDS:2 [Dentiscutata erythropus]|uniref:937_t:CDS:1 n=1 Tax=Dentiscutata erythropus TaxID=1348616 RepID=A0A9N9C0S7_9GLOM|nr:937_t:CDS:2 [Dentiscutata erythropus]